MSKVFNLAYLESLSFECKAIEDEILDNIKYVRKNMEQQTKHKAFIDNIGLHDLSKLAKDQPLNLGLEVLIERIIWEIDEIHERINKLQ